MLKWPLSYRFCLYQPAQKRLNIPKFYFKYMAGNRFSLCIFGRGVPCHLCLNYPEAFGFRSSNHTLACSQWSPFPFLSFLFQSFTSFFFPDLSCHFISFPYIPFTKSTSFMPTTSIHTVLFPLFSCYYTYLWESLISSHWHSSPAAPRLYWCGWFDLLCCRLPWCMSWMPLLNSQKASRRWRNRKAGNL